MLKIAAALVRLDVHGFDAFPSAAVSDRHVPAAGSLLRILTTPSVARPWLVIVDEGNSILPGISLSKPMTKKKPSCQLIPIPATEADRF